MKIATHPLVSPNECAICTQTPDQHEVVVDTEYQVNLPPLRGRKYVCERCGVAVGELFGLVKPAKTTKLQRAYEDAVNELADLRNAIAGL